MRYVTLLRGINVGGKNKLSMADLRRYFEQAGYENVRTYINSGNIIFDAPNSDHASLARAIERVITAESELSIDVVVLSHEQLARIIAKAPKWWGADTAWKHNLIVLLDAKEQAQIIEAIGTLKPDIEAIEPGEGVIYQSMSFEEFGKTTTGKLAASPAYKRLTIRNYNTAHKLLDLLDAV